MALRSPTSLLNLANGTGDVLYCPGPILANLQRLTCFRYDSALNRPLRSPSCIITSINQATDLLVTVIYSFLVRRGRTLDI